jgi:hypothetical protein
MADRGLWHPSEEAIYDLADHALSPEAMIEAQEHVRACPECTRSLRRAEALYARLEQAGAPRLDRDLAPLVVANLQSARTNRARWGWVLAAEAVAATVALAAFGIRLEHWIHALPIDPGHLALRPQGLRLLAEVSSWLAPLLDLIPSFPARLAPVRVALPNLEGPPEGWAGLAAAAMLLGLVGNALLLRTSNGITSQARGAAGGRPSRIGRGSRGGRG